MHVTAGKKCRRLGQIPFRPTRSLDGCNFYNLGVFHGFHLPITFLYGLTRFPCPQTPPWLPLPFLVYLSRSFSYQPPGLHLRFPFPAPEGSIFLPSCPQAPLVPRGLPLVLVVPHCSLGLALFVPFPSLVVLYPASLVRSPQGCFFSPALPFFPYPCPSSLPGVLQHLPLDPCSLALSSSCMQVDFRVHHERLFGCIV